MAVSGRAGQQNAHGQHAGCRSLAAGLTPSSWSETENLHLAPLAAMRSAERRSQGDTTRFSSGTAQHPLAHRWCSASRITLTCVTVQDGGKGTQLVIQRPIFSLTASHFSWIKSAISRSFRTGQKRAHPHASTSSIQCSCPLRVQPNESPAACRTAPTTTASRDIRDLLDAPVAEASYSTQRPAITSEHWYVRRRFCAVLPWVRLDSGYAALQSAFSRSECGPTPAAHSPLRDGPTAACSLHRLPGEINYCSELGDEGGCLDRGHHR